MRRTFIALTLALTAFSCSNFQDAGLIPQDSITVREVTDEPQILGADVPEQNLVPGKLNIKVTEEYASVLEQLADHEGVIREAATKAAGIGNIKSMKRLFPYAGRFEERTRAEGLHLWYEVTYDESVPATKATESFLDGNNIDIIEYKLKIVPVSSEKAVVATPQAASDTQLPFNDPRLKDQWHYINDGHLPYSKAGCDIGVLNAWKYCVGSPDVIVGVVDGGVDYKHEDLADNMWHNPEQTGNAQYGYNFITDNYTVVASEHGTHVAGTIAAVNNNGKGVCGIAGGDAAAGRPGVKIMSCQIFADSDEKNSGNSDAAIKWAADHGAVICQNSWSFPELTYVPTSTKNAIDYFIKYAGIDENGNQTGPIKGGLVFFSAGNENNDYGSPAAYEPVIAVTAVGADYTKAYYSNYGSWTDIAAPGGDDNKERLILSTLPGNKYGYFQGTSMSCPHVSGAAALLVSYFGGKGVTANDIKRSLLDYTTDISEYNSLYLGTGLVNIYHSIMGSRGLAPDKVQDFNVSARSNFVDITVKLPADEDDTDPSYIVVYASKSPIGKKADAQRYQFSTAGKKAGESFSCSIGDLEFSTTYHIAVTACDILMNESALSDEKTVVTENNNPPQIDFTSQNEGLVLRYNQIGYIDFNATDPDGHKLTARLEGFPATTTVETIGNGMRIRINSPSQAAGSYSGTVIVEDPYGASCSAKIAYTILQDQPPVASSNIENIVLNGLDAAKTEIDLSNYFIDEDGDMLKYTVNFKQKNISVSKLNEIVSVAPLDYGYATIEVTAADPKNLIASQTFQVLVRKGGSELDIYPNPVKTQVNFRTAEPQEVDLKIISASGAVVCSASRNISPFEPFSLDLSSIPAGSYTVKAVMGGKTITETLIKL